MRVLVGYFALIVVVVFLCDYIEWCFGNPELRWLVDLFGVL